MNRLWTAKTKEERDTIINEYCKQGRQAKLVTAMVHPEKINIDQFVEMIKKSIEGFGEEVKKYTPNMPNTYPEELMSMYTRWMDLERGNFD